MGIFFFFKQKTAYEMRFSDWSSDVCSSDLYRFSCQRKIADLAPWTLAVLLLNRSERFGGGKPVIGKLLRIEPDAHRVGRCEYLDIAHAGHRSEEHTSELQSLMRISYAVFCLKKKKTHKTQC